MREEEQRASVHVVEQGATATVDEPQLGPARGAAHVARSDYHLQRL